MSRYTIKTLIILGSIAIIGILSIQLYFISSSYKQEGKQLDQSIRIALQNVAEKLSAYHNTSLPYDNIIHQYSQNYYVVNINNIIDVKVLEYYLTKEFTTRNLKLDFDYAIYDCTTDKMVYGNYINLSETKYEDYDNKTFPKWDEYTYYFGVQFRNRKNLIFQNMSVWYFISSILFIVVMFFGYSMFIILRQKRLSEIQKDFIHNITHEFKTPLTSITLSADVLADKNIINEPDRLRKYSDIIKEQSVHLHDQVMKILQSSNNERIKPSLKITDINIFKFINDIIEGFEARLKKENAQINFLAEDENINIKADRTHCKNVIINLIDNALKYSNNKPEIDIMVRKEGKKIILIIRDYGKGIDKKYERKVFEKFFRIPTGNIHNIKGFGLGLSYVKNVVKAHNWKIKLSSKLMEGTEIKIYF